MVTEKGLRRDPELAEKIDKTIFPGMQGGPHDHTTAGIAVALLEASQPKFKEYARQVVTNASVLAKSLMENGITIVTSGTENHLILIDLTPFGNGLGLFAQEALSTAGITVNKNTIPNDPASPFYPSGVRLGTPAITTRGMKEGEMNDIGKIMADAIMEIKDCRMPEDKTNRLACIKDFKVHVKENEKLAELRVQVLDLCKRFPLYAGLEM